MMLWDIYKFELKKLFCIKVNVIAMAGSVIMLVFLAMSAISEEEPVMNVRDSMIRALDKDIDLTQISETGLYELREKEIAQRMETQGLSDQEKEWWYSREAEVQKPFVFRAHRGPAGLLRAFQALGFFVLLLSAIGLSGTYARETGDSMNQLLLCSRYGKRKLYTVKLFAGFTWILAAALMVFLSVLIPYLGFYGMEGTEEMLQLVKPLSMLPYSIGHMLAVYTVIYLLSAVLFAAVTMLLSVVTQNQLATICGLMGYLLIDLFVEFPDRYRVLQKIWFLRPNAILMNAGFSNYRLIRLADRFLLNYQAAPLVYLVIIIAALLVGRQKYRRLQIGK